MVKWLFLLQFTFAISVFAEVKPCNEQCIEVRPVVGSKIVDQPMMIHAQVQDQLGEILRRFDVDIIGQHDLSREFDAIAARSDIPFKYVYNGCYARAHKISRLLEEENIMSGKIFALGYLAAQGIELGVPKTFTWAYHVASFIAVNTNDVVEIAVIDPSLASHALSLAEWLQAMTKHSGARIDQVYFAHRYHYTPSDQTLNMEQRRDAYIDDMNKTNQTNLEKLRTGQPRK